MVIVFLLVAGFDPALPCRKHFRKRPYRDVALHLTAESGADRDGMG